VDLRHHDAVGGRQQAHQLPAVGDLHAEVCRGLVGDRDVDWAVGRGLRAGGRVGDAVATGFGVCGAAARSDTAPALRATPSAPMNGPTRPPSQSASGRGARAPTAPGPNRPGPQPPRPGSCNPSRPAPSSSSSFLLSSVYSHVSRTSGNAAAARRDRRESVHRSASAAPRRPGYCILTATSRPSSSRALCTWGRAAVEAAAVAELVSAVGSSAGLGGLGEWGV
jgi:hypothetical protein